MKPAFTYENFIYPYTPRLRSRAEVVESLRYWRSDKRFSIRRTKTGYQVTLRGLHAGYWGYLLRRVKVAS
jgi:hypothetical protein